MQDFIKNNRDLLSAYSAIFLGAVIGFTSVKILGEAMDQHVLRTCNPVKIYPVHSMFGERIFCKN